MLTFLSRRLVASIIVLLLASYLVYILSANAGDPLAELRVGTAKNQEALIQMRAHQLHLDIPTPLRYFLWLGGILQGFVGHFTLGVNVQGEPVTGQIADAVVVTIQLIVASTILAIVFGILIGITTALRQYSGYDYTVTFLSFLFFSLPSFFIAVILKAYVGIAFNNYLADPHVAWWAYVILPLVSGGIWTGIIGGNARRRWMTFVIATLATLFAVVFVAVTNWLETPTLGAADILLVAIVAGGLAVLITALTTGLENRKSLYTALTTVAVGVALYFPFLAISDSLNLLSLLGLGVVAAAVGLLIGWLYAGYDRWQSARTGAIVAVVTGLVIVANRLMRSWHTYVEYVANGRPIATVGAVTPNLDDISTNFWIHSLDTFTHLLLPTISLCLISIASYSRYARANLLDVLNSDYIRTARAKGLNQRTIVMRHAFRNALIPLTTIVAFDIGSLLGGAIITETVFSWSGMGNLFNQALKVVDVNTLMGFFVVTAIAAIVFNFLADLAYSALDPRIRVTA
ncbi:ABC transporter permease [Gryllotalpicola ginsengisoli]|uniref:ABC transporter permease n=1 Tax=Gryllotalpicola ginsengisoli TaxID=444608 RepID=UPI0003B4BD23|nr:ABC transporter permease [Gryllotalpicola ginsengisoli]